MKKALILVGMLAMILSGCHTFTRSFGGEMEIDLPAGQKIEEITWKDSTLWYLTRPMQEDETAEIHVFQADSEWGVFEGTVTIVEHAQER